MALHQLIHVPNNQNEAVQEWTGIIMDRPIEWNDQLNMRIARNGDLWNDVYFKMNVGPAPAGYRWKKNWTAYFFKDVQLKIANETIWTSTTVSQLMRLMTHPNKNKAATFNYSVKERNQISRDPHTISYSPIFWDIPVPLVAIMYQLVELQITTGTVRDCVEPIVNEEVINEVPLEIDCHCLYTYLNGEERRNLAREPFENPIITNDYTSDEVRIGNGEVLTRHGLDNIASCAYLWITGENYKELDSSILDSIEILLNDHVRQKHDNFDSRHIVRNNLPHTTSENNISKNLYYINFWSGRRVDNGMEQGLNMSRVDNYQWKMKFKPGMEGQQIHLHMIHRTQNILQIRYGLSQLRFLPNVIVAPRLPYYDHKPFENIIFNNMNAIIDIKEDEPQCMISYVDFKDNDDVCKCLKCKKIFLFESLKSWFNQPYKSLKCVHCSGEIKRDTMSRGKANVIL